MPRSRSSPLTAATIDRIQQMARDTPLWGAARIRGELLKLDIRVSKRTIQTYLRQGRPTRPPGLSWATFLRNHRRLAPFAGGGSVEAAEAVCAAAGPSAGAARGGVLGDGAGSRGRSDGHEYATRAFAGVAID